MCPYLYIWIATETSIKEKAKIRQAKIRQDKLRLDRIRTDITRDEKTSEKRQEAKKMEQQTPIYDWHVQNGGKMVSFGGYQLPIQYQTGIINEHLAVRQNAGIFDVSHMGEIRISGQDGTDFLNYLLTNDFTDMTTKDVRYSPMCNHQGGVVDDLLVYRLEAEEYLLVVNAANRQKDDDWMKQQYELVREKYPRIVIQDESQRYGQIALQGPKAAKILAELVFAPDIPAAYYSVCHRVQLDGIECMISRTGYTGEDGFEIYVSADRVQMVWHSLIGAGEKYQLCACGLGARDTLRLEAGMPLYGHELNEQLSPKVSRLGFAVRLDKPNFIGKQAIEQTLPPTQKLIGLKIIGRGIARPEAKVYDDGVVIGQVTSGTFLPYLQAAYAMAIIDQQYARVGRIVQVEVRGRLIEAEIVKLPFYQRRVETLD